MCDALAFLPVDALHEFPQRSEQRLKPRIPHSDSYLALYVNAQHN